MIEQAAILSTSVGPVGAIVSRPEADPRAALILMQGGGPPCRSGVNAVWTRFARELARRGAAVLRFDFAGEGESILAGADIARQVGWRRNADLAIAHELAPWFRRSAGLEELLVVGSCHGGRVAFDFAAEDDGVRGTFLVVPYLWNKPAHMRPDKLAARSKSLPWASELYDYGSSSLRDQRQGPVGIEADTDRSPLEESFVERARALLAGGPAWILIGEGDSQRTVELKRRLGEGGETLEVEVVPDTIIHPVTHPEIQALVTARLLERIDATVAAGAR